MPHRRTRNLIISLPYETGNLLRNDRLFLVATHADRCQGTDATSLAVEFQGHNLAVSEAATDPYVLSHPNEFYINELRI